MTVVLVFLTTPAHAAEFPPEELLDSLRTGLLQDPDCGRDCATVGRLALEASADRLRLRLEISAAAATALPLPGQTKHWEPSDVTLDGKPAPALTRDDNGTVWLHVGPGSHQVMLEGPLPAREVVQLPLPRKPHAITTSLRGWKLDGVGEDGEIADSLQLTREARGPRAASSALGGTSLPPFVSVERSLQLGLKWQVATRVTRLTPAGSAVLIEVPLLPGESPISEGVRVVGGKVQVTMAPDASEQSWTSTLQQRPTLSLRAPRSPSFTEVWSLEASAIWHVEVSGLAPVLRDPAAARVPRWQPWPDETLTLAVTRPGGTEGQTLTIQSAELEIRPGARSTSLKLVLALHASRGGQHVLTLPAGATLESLLVDGATQPLRVESGHVTVPVKPAHQSVELGLRVAQGLAPLFHAPIPDLGAPAVNVTTTIALPADRWVLLAGGPRLGPSVLFWSTAIVLVLIGLALGRSSLTPLRARHWVLLGLGLSQTPVPAIAIVAGFFLVMGLRARKPELRRVWFNLRQVGLLVWTIVAVGILFVAVEEGLLSTPDMQVAGNGSSRELLRWFADRTASTPPAPWVVSLPLVVYRVAMLAWALWLALAVIRWSRWAWRSFSEGGLWQPKRRPEVETPAPPRS
jgi:hypothetical protein